MEEKSFDQEARMGQKPKTEVRIPMATPPQPGPGMGAESQVKWGKKLRMELK